MTIEVKSDTIGLARKSWQKGRHGTFLKIGNRGLKLYSRPDLRDRHYWSQRKLANKGLAPFTDGCVDVIDDSGCTWYAYWTGIAQMAGCVHEFGYQDCDECVKPTGHIERSVWQKELDCDDLEDRLLDAGYVWRDVHPGNWGYVNGRAVLVDCEPDGTS